ncbi:MAG: hypothetical protein U1E17_06270 [Geminicoccaceae bacterium]
MADKAAVVLPAIGGRRFAKEGYAGGAIAVKAGCCWQPLLLLRRPWADRGAPAPAPVGQLLAAPSAATGRRHRSWVAKPDQPALRLYLRWRLAEGKAARAQPPFAAYADFLERYRDWPSLGLLQQRAWKPRSTDRWPRPSV